MVRTLECDLFGSGVEKFIKVTVRAIGVITGLGGGAYLFEILKGHDSLVQSGSGLDSRV